MFCLKLLMCFKRFSPQEMLTVLCYTATQYCSNWKKLWNYLDIYFNFKKEKETSTNFGINLHNVGHAWYLSVWSLLGEFQTLRCFWVFSISLWEYVILSERRWWTIIIAVSALLFLFLDSKVGFQDNERRRNCRLKTWWTEQAWGGSKTNRIQII